MEFVYDRDGNVDSWEAVMFLYKSALKKMTLNMQILNDEFEYVHQYNPIERPWTLRIRFLYQTGRLRVGQC